MRWEYALAASLVCVTFVFVSTTNLSYNTLGAGLLVIGMALGARAVVGGGRERWLAAAGVAQALAALAYPTLVAGAAGDGRLPGGLGAGAPPARRVARLGPGRRRHSAGRGAPAGKLRREQRAALPALAGLRLARAQPIERSRQALGLVTGVERHLDLCTLVVVAALVLWLAYRRWPLARLALVLTPLALLPFGQQLVSGGDGFGVIYGLAAPYFFLFVPAERAPWPPACWSGAICRRWRPG